MPGKPRPALRPARPPKPDPNRRELSWIGIALTPFDRAVIEELFRRGGFSRLDDVIMAGLWQLARQYEIDVPVTTFRRAREKGHRP